MINYNDYSYIAGLFDGEGYVGKYGNTKKLIEIRITNNNYDCLIFVKNVFGGNVYERKRKGSFDLVIRRQCDVMVFLSSILPYSIIKRDRIKRIISG